MSGEAVSIPPAADPRLGTILSERYRITRRLGEGGMGIVYDGEHLLIRRRVAIKMLHTHLSGNAELVTRFRREAIAATSIRHPHIVEVLDMGTAPDGAAYMVLEFLEGTDWSKNIEATGPQRVGHAVRIMRQVCDGLQAAHDKGIVHRDLKPENVFLITEGQQENFAKIVDFGISKMTGEQNVGGAESHSLTRTGAAMGTAYYMAPEQLKGARDLDHRADLWALGVMLYHALTAAYPFDADTFPMLAVNVLTGDPAPIDRYRGDLPAELVAIIGHLLQKNRDHRYQSARDLRAALAPFEEIAAAPEVRKRAAFAATQTPDTPMTYARSGTHEVPPGTTPGSAIGPGTGPQQPFANQGTGPIAPARTPVPATAVGQPGLHAQGAITGPFGESGPQQASAQQPLGTFAGTGTPSLGTSVILPPSRAPLGAIIGVLVTLLVVGGGAAAYVGFGGSPAPETVPTAPVPPPVAPTPVAPEAPVVVAPPVVAPPAPVAPSGPTVRVQISTEPAEAALTLDGQPISNPFDADLPSTSDVHHIEAVLEGRTTESTDVTFAFPQRVVLRLERGPRSRDHGTTTTPPTPPTTSHETTPPAHVDPPVVTAPPVTPPTPPATEDTPREGRPLRSPFAH